MGRRSTLPGGQAEAIVFSDLKGEFAGQEAPELKGTVNFTDSQILKTRIEDVHSPRPHHIVTFMQGMIKMTMLLPPDSRWIRASVIDDASVEITFANGLVVSATGVDLEGDAVEEDLTAGETSELTMSFLSATQK